MSSAQHESPPVSAFCICVIFVQTTSVLWFLEMSSDSPAVPVSAPGSIPDPTDLPLLPGARVTWLLGEPSNPDFKLSDLYVVESKLGRHGAPIFLRLIACSGNFSEVYKVRSKETGKVSAAKVIKKSKLTSPKVRVVDSTEPHTDICPASFELADRNWYLKEL